jgi:hypothetical protein
VDGAAAKSNMLVYNHHHDIVNHCQLHTCCGVNIPQQLWSWQQLGNDDSGLFSLGSATVLLERTC